MDFVGKVRDFVESECKKPSSKYGYDPFPFHFVPMVDYATKLADELGADREIVAIASWLHDIGSIVVGREEHHITGSKIAEEKLKELGYPPEKIELVKSCIFNHRGQNNFDRSTLEEKIVAEADVMSNFDNLPGIFMAAFLYEGKNQMEAKISAREKLERKWRQLHFESSKRIVEPKYKAIMILLK
jgi:uncharacterized protein